MARYREATPPGGHRPDTPWGGDDSELDVFPAERYFNGDDALWCGRSSSSFSSAFRIGTTTQEHGWSAVTATAATSSSEASWNSRSALLPDGKVLADAIPSLVEAESRVEGSERPRGKPPPPSSYMRRWLLGVAGCACVGGDGEESASGDELCLDEVEDDTVARVAVKKTLSNGAGELIERTESKVEATSVRVRPGRWLHDGDELLAGKAAFSPVQVQLGGDGHRRTVNSGEFPTPTEQNSAFTIVAGNSKRGGASPAGTQGRPGTSPCDTSEDDTAPSELGSAYPPSEASVVWSVVTAEGAASCNFSSAASGYYYHFNGGEDGGRSNRSRRRRSGLTNSGGLLTCMGDKAVNAIGPLAGGPAGHDGYTNVMRRR